MLRLLYATLLLSSLSYAGTIDCYNGGQNIYHGKGHHIMYGDNWIAFERDGSEVVIFGSCVAKESLPRKHHKH